LSKVVQTIVERGGDVKKRFHAKARKEEKARIQCLSSARSANIHVRLRLRRERKISLFARSLLFALSREPLL
jgi:hypothetical protein